MSNVADPVGAERRPRRGPLADFPYRLVREKPLGLLGAAIVAVFVLVSVFADVLAPDPEQRQDVTKSMRPPLRRASAGHRSHRARLPEPQHLRRAPVAAGRLRGDRGGGAGGHRGRRPVGVRRRPARPAAAAHRGRLVGVSGPVAADDGDVDSGHRHAAGDRDTGAGVRNRQLARGAGRGDRRQGERLLPGRAGGRQPDLAHGAAPRAAQRDAADHHHLQHHHRLGDHHRGQLELPRLRAAAERAELGRPAEPRGPPLHAGSAVAGHVAGHLPDRRGVRLQHVRRRGARPARPPPGAAAPAASPPPAANTLDGVGLDRTKV